MKRFEDFVINNVKWSWNNKNYRPIGEQWTPKKQQVDTNLGKLDMAELNHTGFEMQYQQIFQLKTAFNYKLYF